VSDRHGAAEPEPLDALPASTRRAAAALLEQCWPGTAAVIRRARALLRCTTGADACAPADQAWVVRDGDAVVGHIAARAACVRIAGQPHRAVGVWGWCVAPDHARRGAGSALFGAAVAAAQQQGAVLLCSTHEPRLLVARGLAPWRPVRWRVELPRGWVHRRPVAASERLRPVNPHDRGAVAELLAHLRVRAWPEVPVAVEDRREHWLARAVGMDRELAHVHLLPGDRGAIVFDRVGGAITIFEVVAPRPPALLDVLAAIEPALHGVELDVDPGVFADVVVDPAGDVPRERDPTRPHARVGPAPAGDVVVAQLPGAEMTAPSHTAPPWPPSGAAPRSPAARPTGPSWSPLQRI